MTGPQVKGQARSEHRPHGGPEAPGHTRRRGARQAAPQGAAGLRHEHALDEQTSRAPGRPHAGTRHRWGPPSQRPPHSVSSTIRGSAPASWRGDTALQAASRRAKHKAQGPREPPAGPQGLLPGRANAPAPRAPSTEPRKETQLSKRHFPRRTSKDTSSGHRA